MRKTGQSLFLLTISSLLNVFVFSGNLLAAEDEEDKRLLDEIIITATARKDITALETSYGVAVLSRASVDREVAVGLVDLLDAVPGLYAEAAGGEANTNLSARGTRPGFNAFISLQEDGLPVLYRPIGAEWEIRHDITYERVEVVLGGPSTIFAPQAAAATVNFMSRLPENTVSEVRLSVTDYGRYRTDLFYGGPISDNWFGSIGGYYRRGDGIRDHGFTVSHGGQLRANLWRDFSGGDGSVLVSYRHTDDNTPTYAPGPVNLADGQPAPIAGFNFRDDTLVGPDIMSLKIKRPGGMSRNYSYADGQDANSNQASLRITYDLGNGFRVKEHLRIASNYQADTDLRNGANSDIVDAATFVADSAVTLLAAFPTATAFQLVQVADGTVIADPTSLNGNGLLMAGGTRLSYFATDFSQIINDFQVTFEGDRNTATIGLMYWNTQAATDFTEVVYLLDLKPNANLMDVQALDATGAVVGHLTDNGVRSYDNYWMDGNIRTESINLYFNDEFQISDSLRIDFGARFEDVTFSGDTETLTFGNAIAAGLNDPLVLADDAVGAAGTGNYVASSSNVSEVAWTIGANYKFNDNLAVYARYTDTFDMGNAAFTTFGFPPAFTTVPTTLKVTEIGVRYQSETLALFATGFYTDNAEVAFTTDTGTNFPVDNEVIGVEFLALWQPTDVFSVEFSGVVQDAELTDTNSTGSSFDGNRIDRLPNIQLRLTPTVYFGLGSAYVSIQHYGNRFGDLANTQEFDPYTAVDAGISYNLNDSIWVSLQGTNLTNEFAATLGNPRGNAIIAGDDAFGFAALIPPRSITATVSVSF